jgi:glycosyltransferase involved in cell wall biosynthesis
MSGGSVGHVAGVVNALGTFGRDPVVFQTDRIPTIREDIEQHELPVADRFWDFDELPSLASNDAQRTSVEHALGSRRPQFVYQRYSLNNYVGVALASSRHVPLVTEYNGSELWIASNWGKPLRHADVARQIEDLNLKASDIVVVVSQPMFHELVARGVDPARILVNPNGVDPDLYSPAIDGSKVRSRFELGDAVVFGFIGTFSAWHGAEVLAEAFVRMIRARPGLIERVRLLMIGDGPRLEATQVIVEEAGLGSAVKFIGRTRQEDGPSYLAACDVLVSPHVPNSDGSPFFGSPTKLFEYMAMGKAIVASRLDQIGEVLTDDVTGVLVPPRDAAGLAAAMSALVDDPARRARLGTAVRADAVANHTWREHTRRIVEKLHSMYA